MSYCGKCRYWKIEKVENVIDTVCCGECRWHAPVVGTDGKWPLTMYKDGCGQFRIRDDDSKVVDWTFTGRVR